MAKLNCPACKTVMDAVKDPDITTDRCPHCGGVFLDKEELNVLATGYSGDIEWCSARSVVDSDIHAHRQCARCPDNTMAKVSMLMFSDLIFDHCESCGSFFLDRGEVVAMNRELESSTKTGSAEEFRETLDGHLVRIDVLSQVYLGASGGRLVPGYVLRITVYFREPANAGLRLYRERLTGKLARLLSLKQDIQVGDSKFDSSFMIQGDDEDRVKALLTSATKSALLGLLAKKPQVFTRSGSLEVLDNRVVYTEGPYKEEVTYDPKADSASVVAALLEVATAINAAVS